jgi:5-methylcytosine-specific restriction protein A
MAWGKESRQARGYGAKWDRKRKRILERDCGLCQCRHCKASGAINIATEVDHIVSKAKARAMRWTDEQIEADSNLQSINHDCHLRKTEEEQGKTKRPKVTIGLDGWPVEG